MQEFSVDIESLIVGLRVEWEKRADINTHALTRVKDMGENIMACCPFHIERKPSFGIKKDYPYQYNCFSCGASGRVENLVQHIYDTSYLNAVKILRSKYSDYNFDFDLDTFYDEEEREVIDESLKYQGVKHSYITDRGISDYTLLKYEVGYDPETYSITFPVRDINGNYMFTIKRNIAEKFYHIPEDVSKGDTLYGLSYLRGKVDTIDIVEGMVDVLSCYEGRRASVGLMGKSLSRKQVELLIASGIKTVNLFLDNDKWGVVGALKSYKLLDDYPLKVNMVRYPTSWGIDCIDCEYKDPNDLLLGGIIEKLKIEPFINYYLEIKNSKYLRGIKI